MGRGCAGRLRAPPRPNHKYSLKWQPYPENPIRHLLSIQWQVMDRHIDVRWKHRQVKCDQPPPCGRTQPGNQKPDSSGHFEKPADRDQDFRSGKGGRNN